MVSLRDLEVVSWDVDGTLYSVPRLWAAMTELGVQRLLGSGARRSVRELLALRRFRNQMEKVREEGGELSGKDSPWPADRRLEVEGRWYGQAMARIGARQGVRAVLERLEEAGLRQVVVSDYECAYKLDRLELERVFERTFAGESVGHIKPSPRLFEAVTVALHVEPQRLLHIGDRRDRDGASAGAAGCNVLILGEDFRSFPELLTQLA